MISRSIISKHPERPLERVVDASHFEGSIMQTRKIIRPQVSKAIQFTLLSVYKEICESNVMDFYLLFFFFFFFRLVVLTCHSPE